MSHPDDSQVLEANDAFYRAFRNRSFEAMNALWSRAHLVACAHPGWHILYGRDEVMASWKSILSDESGPWIEHDDARAFVYGDWGLVTCTEKIRDARLVATNVFVLEQDDWRMVHHHASPFSRRVPSTAAPPRSSLN